MKVFVFLILLIITISCNENDVINNFQELNGELFKKSINYLIDNEVVDTADYTKIYLYPYFSYLGNEFDKFPNNLKFEQDFMNYLIYNENEISLRFIQVDYFLIDEFNNRSVVLIDYQIKDKTYLIFLRLELIDNNWKVVEFNMREEQSMLKKYLQE